VPKNRRLILFDDLAEDISLPGADLIYDLRFVQRWRSFDMSLNTIIPESAKTGTGSSVNRSNNRTLPCDPSPGKQKGRLLRAALML